MSNIKIVNKRTNPNGKENEVKYNYSTRENQNHKENNSYVINNSNKNNKSIIKKSVSPIKRTNQTTNFKKVELKLSKSPQKIDHNTQKISLKQTKTS